MESKLSKLDLQLYKAIDEVLHYTWDPIGISTIPEVRDEYWSYLPVVFEMVRAGQSEKDIARYLGKISSEQMGLALREEHDLKIARILVQWRVINQDS